MEPNLQNSFTQKTPIDKQDKQRQKSLFMVSQSIRSLNQKTYLSDFQSHGTFPIPLGQNELKIKAQQSLYSQGAHFNNSHKRLNPIQIHPTLIKKIKKNNSVSQQPLELMKVQQQVGNRKITDFFGSKAVQKLKKTESTKQQQQKNPIIKSLKQKIIKKQACIEETNRTIDDFKQKQYNLQKQFEQYKLTRKKKILEVLKTNFQLKIFQSGLKKINKLEKISANEEKIKDLQERCRNLKDVKQRKKNKSKKDHFSDEQSNILMEAYDKDRINYLSGWMNKLEKEKQKCLGEQNRFQTYKQINYSSLPQIIKNVSGKQGIIFQNYAPLATVSKVDLNYQVLAMNLQTLNYEIMYLIKEPTIFAAQRRNLLQKTLRQYHFKVRQVNHHNIYLSSKLYQNLTKSIMIFSREHWQQSKKLKELIQYYQCLSQSIAKYIIKICLQTISQIKKKTSIQIILSSDIILVNEKFDIKIDGNPSWILPIFRQFRNQFDKNCLQYYSCQLLQKNGQDFTKNIGVWSIGILFYELIYGKKPFQYESQEDIKVEDFYLKNQFNESSFPNKSGVSQGCKQFIKYCLQNQNQRPTISLALKHSYFSPK